jgi:hypothetical protein
MIRAAELNQPWYVRLLSKESAAVIGVGFMLWWFAAKADSEHLQLLMNQAQLTNDMHTHIEASQASQAEVLFYLRALCVNLSDTPEQRRNCIPPYER